MKLYRILFIACLSWYMTLAQATDISGAVDNVLGPMANITELAFKLGYLMGFGLLAGSIMRYFEHRRNPTAVPMVQVVTLFMIGLAVLGISFGVQYSTSAEFVKQYYG